MRAKSGGLFIEHGVHFFDLLEGWLGPGQMISAQQSIRPDTTLQEQVNCTVRYGQTVLVNFYHGFHQAGRLDRQELRLVFERGDIRLFSWVPTGAHLHVLVDEAQTKALQDLFPDSRLDVTMQPTPPQSVH